MTVAELIAFLQTQKQDLPVAYARYSEHCILEAVDISVEMACEARPDGWIQRHRPDMPLREYLMLPG